ncbi:S13-like H2TH domain-containing protein [Coprinopsis marcescibilis]|uniref:S13-like H2TH domain-containing protein n=1 Tax=Coprinopsis marcescibilis TaxID=230819 RepID=A0A5C3LC10_COPMA|nr:S13-like H2TH domain-containing protein [Coprinopsis marcescibilis]
MVHILGISLPDQHLAKFALTSIYGVGHKTAHRLCARFQIHDKCKVKELSPFQVTSLASFLSSPRTAPPLPRYPLASSSYVPPPPSTPMSELQAKFKEAQAAIEAKKQRRAELGKKIKTGTYVDPLKKLTIESELRREIRENIAHQRMIGSYVGKRHAMHLPVRGQNTQSNARTAKRLNKLERW